MDELLGTWLFSLLSQHVAFLNKADISCTRLPPPTGGGFLGEVVGGEAYLSLKVYVGLGPSWKHASLPCGLAACLLPWQ